MDNDNLRTVIGKKQIMRLAKENELEKIQIATDVDADYAKAISAVARTHNVPVVFESNMEELAKRYSIDVPCGAVGFVKIR